MESNAKSPNAMGSNTSDLSPVDSKPKSQSMDNNKPKDKIKAVVSSKDRQPNTQPINHPSYSPSKAKLKNTLKLLQKSNSLDSVSPPPTTGSPSSPRKNLFCSRVNSVLANLDYEHCDPDMVVNMLRSPSTKIISALHTKLKRCDAEWLEGFLDNNGFNVSM